MADGSMPAPGPTLTREDRRDLLEAAKHLRDGAKQLGIYRMQQTADRAVLSAVKLEALARRKA